MGLIEQENVSPEEMARLTSEATGLAGSIRALVQTTVVSEVTGPEVAEAIALIDAARQILERDVRPGSFGVRFNVDGSRRTWGNAMTGVRNPIAPPLAVTFDGDRVLADATLGPAYEGPPGLVHGGILAAVLDQMLGIAAEHAGAPGMTGTLTIRYRRGTRLGPIHAEAWLDRIDGVKTFTKGEVSTADGVTAEVEGVFILPKWARERAARGERPSSGDA